MKTVDLRSDTVTQPTAAMRAAMAAAPVGDDVFGDDPSINSLQDKLAAMLGFEAALFVPTGTQSNLCGLMAHCQRGDEYIVGQMAHTYRWEGGGAAVLGSIQPQPLEHQADGTLALADIEAAIKPDDAHFAKTRLLTLENTFGGKLLPLDYVQAATDLAKSHGLSRHLDGARLFNAAVAQATQLAGNNVPNLPQSLTDQGQAAITYEAIVKEACRIAQCFDSVSVCLSKGLGAPIGSILCGSADFIARAHRIRKMVGGGMRQAGILAAAGSHALDHHVARLADDHGLARRLADGLQGLPGVVVEPPQTNIVFVDLVDGAKARGAGLIPHLKSHGVLATGLYRLRFVTHLDVDAAGIDHAVSVIRAYFEHH
ncbi:GntG family PLP-dependent aldolase [Rhodoferax fermentans]|uniref:Threonine aldolase n=1 Tax=Rhodoferax fermentans TaxID=28066 RepID=A0A1T1AYS5_RHOFE|nr:GntG family PLP-dependent aldolase [Rhodoferax fermentans]MBK1685376.1 threonine aldolase [Rhodoferax fermentans]OOV09135.1 threonine aldolase [Rhodoferax fermentans]